MKYRYMIIGWDWHTIRYSNTMAGALRVVTTGCTIIDLATGKKTIAE